MKLSKRKIAASMIIDYYRYKVSIKEHNIKCPVELCGSIFFLAELCQAVEAGKLDVK
jgi:hypothetical protein